MNVNIDFKKSSLSFKNLKLSYKIRDILKREEFDVIYLHTSLAAFWVRMALRGVKKKPYTTGFFFYFNCEGRYNNQCFH